MDTRQVIARFEAERQALAMMDHPNIAKVLDAGTTGEENRGQRSEVSGERSALAPTSDLRFPTSHLGRPYFVMELVRGVPITQYCDEKQLSLRDRLKLFLPVCQAVQHAHQKGIIHRDIKPTNVLVAEYDNYAVPKVIDFGVAKATAQKLTERTMFTEFGQLVGTFEYMSPEQAKLNQLDIDTRSDIYSLGVLLYELLTGDTPFDRKRLHNAAFDEVLRIIREDEPPKPSARLTTLRQQDDSTVAARRSSDPRRLCIQVRGELDWIVMKALEKDRNRRYETASGFAADVERHLRDEPVEAGPPSAKYRLRKFARRNKAALAMAGVITAGLLLGIVGLATTAIIISQARDSVQQSLDRERRTAYFQRVALAEREWSAGNLSRAVDLLNDCPQDLRGWEWRYLKRLHGRQVQPWRHDSSVYGCAISPDGGEIASIDHEGYITVWDSTSSRQLRRFRGHDETGWCVAFSPDGVRLASGDRSGNVKVWDARTAEELRAWKMPGAASYIDAIAFSPDGSRLAVANSREESSNFSSTTTLWDPLSGEQVLKLPKQNDYVKSIAFSSDGRLFAAACLDGTVRISDAVTGETRRTFHGDAGFWCIAFSPDGRLIAAASGGREWESSGAVTIWEVVTGDERFTLPGHGAKYLTFSPDGQRLASGGTDLTVRVWDVPTGQEALTLRGHTDYLRTVAFTPDGDRLISASDDRTIRIWDGTPWQRGEKRGEELTTLRGHTDGLNALAFHPKKPQLVTGSSDGTVKTWDAETGREISSLSTDLEVVQSLAFSPDGAQIVFAGSPRGSATVVDASSGERLRRIGAHVEDIWAVAFNRDGSRLASGGGSDGVVMISDFITGALIHRLEGHRWYVGEVTFSSDSQGRLLASAGSDGTVRIWDTTTGREIAASPLAHEGVVDGMAFSPDSQFLASGGSDGIVRIWDTATWKPAPVSLPTNGNIRCLAFNPDGQLLAWGTSNAVVQVWNKATGDIQTLRGHLKVVRGVAFSPDGRFIASASQDGTAKIWATSREKETK
jgi:WD40 repeat protein